MTTLRERSQSPSTATDPSPQSPTGTWTIDPAARSVSLTWGRHRRRSVTGRLRCFGVIHLDALPPVGVIQFEQPSGLPVLTIALHPASAGAHDAGFRGPEGLDVQRQRWWTLRSQSLEVLPTGAWRVMATVTTDGTEGLVELGLAVDPKASSAGWLVLGGGGVLDWRPFGTGRAPPFTPQIRLDLAVRARRVQAPHLYREER
jgi:hypothetical protein